MPSPGGSIFLTQGQTCVSSISCISRQALCDWHHLGSPDMLITLDSFFFLGCAGPEGSYFPDQESNPRPAVEALRLNH